MATTKAQHNRSSRDRDQQLSAYARQGHRVSLRWGKEERKNWRTRDRELLSGPFIPRERDDREIAFYFRCGKDKPLRGLNPEQQKTWSRVHRNLDGRGHNLMLHYTKAGTPDELGLRIEYRRYVQNTGRSYARSEWEPYIVAPDWQLRRFLKPPRFEIVRHTNFRTGQTAWKQEATVDNGFSHRFVNYVNTLEVMLAETETSTWGDRRISPQVARHLLEFGAGLTVIQAKSLGDEQALERLQDILTFIGKRVAPPADGPTERQLPPLSPRELKRQRLRSREEIKELHEQPEVGGTLDWLGVQGQALAVDFWDPRKIENEVGQEWTTVSRIAEEVRKLIGLRDHAWVRSALVKLECPEAERPRGKLPTFWFVSDKGRAFWEAARREKVARDLQQMAGASTRFSAVGRRR